MSSATVFFGDEEGEVVAAATGGGVGLVGGASNF